MREEPGMNSICIATTLAMVLAEYTDRRLCRNVRVAAMRAAAPGPSPNAASSIAQASWAIMKANIHTPWFCT
jgi:hypothetical protein